MIRLPLPLAVTALLAAAHDIFPASAGPESGNTGTTASSTDRPSVPPLPDKVHPERFGLRVVDDATGRGVPLVELRTVNETRHVTDSAGWIAFEEPGLMGQDVFWHISGPGIEGQKDGFGYAGVRAVARPGTAIEVKVRRTTIAERHSRLTGQGIFRDSKLLGLPGKGPVPDLTPPGVVGQDSVQAVPFQGKLFWLWGDTSVAKYPLGNFHTTCATTPLNAHPDTGLVFDYFTDPAHPENLRKMMPSSAPGVVWMFGLMTVSAEDGTEHLLSGYTRQQGLVPPDEKGIAEFDPAAGYFKSVATVNKDEKWRAPAGHAVRVQEGADDHWYFCLPLAHTRVRATLAAMRDPAAYETFRFDEAKAQWHWQTAAAPTTQEEEKKLLAEGKMKPEQARHQIVDAATGDPVQIHGASIQWNAWRKRYILTGVQMGGKNAPSFLGEVWYSEADHVTGPWRKAVKIATHPNYSFYNPVHHRFFDQQGGKIIWFEGTYTREFSGNPVPTPRYDYNQLLYRLDLSDPRLEAAR